MLWVHLKKVGSYVMMIMLAHVIMPQNEQLPVQIHHRFGHFTMDILNNGNKRKDFGRNRSCSYLSIMPTFAWCERGKRGQTQSGCTTPVIEPGSSRLKGEQVTDCFYLVSRYEFHDGSLKLSFLKHICTRIQKRISENSLSKASNFIWNDSGTNIKF